VFKLAGFAASSVSALYLAASGMQLACAVVEYLPSLSLATAKPFLTLVSEKHVMGPMAALWTLGGLAAAVVVRKCGTALSDPANVEAVERFLYRTRAPGGSGAPAGLRDE
jgi:ABC-type thiamin/hydroxymethylpyrimidine transport system permease subunit